ncbi:MAG: peptide chain release factor N(5)-glutamine methyltransferase [Chloroflexi bacterium]|nr:peptide chain release factor N(5)-glutamine methyltransferase [Chloroflexota bacterium]MYD48034.1 peptide chain release factor N(5)-glutamine methyltransferase [Chloroflexota bacterium]
MPNLRSVIQATHRTLESAGIPDARLEAEVMVMDVMRMPRQAIFAEQESQVAAQQEAQLAAIVERRLTREPLAYILNYREFYGVNLLVNPDVLIPRPETETLVEHALFMALMGMESRELVIADVGTGTGAIAVNLAIHLPAARIYAIDAYDATLDVAAYNVRMHNVADRVTLLKGDLLEPLPEPVDVIAANLPYLPTARIPTLQPEVQWEPSAALDGGVDGLDLIRRLITQAATSSGSGDDRLKPHGVILLEMDPEQMDDARGLAAEQFPDAEITAEPDLAGRERVLSVSLAGSDDGY